MRFEDIETLKNGFAAAKEDPSLVSSFLDDLLAAAREELEKEKGSAPLPEDTDAQLLDYLSERFTVSPSYEDLVHYLPAKLNCILTDASFRQVAPAEDAPAAAEAPEKAAPAPTALLQGIDIDEQVINQTSRMTPAYLNMLEQRRKEEEAAMAEAAAALRERENRKKALVMEAAHLEQIIADNRKALFGKKRKTRKAAEEKLEQLKKELEQFQ